MIYCCSSVRIIEKLCAEFFHVHRVIFHSAINFIVTTHSYFNYIKFYNSALKRLKFICIFYLKYYSKAIKLIQFIHYYFFLLRRMTNSNTLILFNFSKAYHLAVRYIFHEYFKHTHTHIYLYYRYVILFFIFQI